MSVRDFVAEMEHLAGKKAELVSAPMMNADVTLTFADISKARRLLGYDPRVSVKEGVRRSFEWYRAEVAHSHP